MSVRVLSPTVDRDVYARFVRDVYPHFEGYRLDALPRGTTLTGQFADGLPHAAPGTEHLLMAAVAVLRHPAAHEVLDVAVRPGARRQGHARTVLATVIRGARAEHLPVWLEVRADNLAALALYETMGFTATGTRKAYYRDVGGATVDAVLMARPAD